MDIYRQAESLLRKGGYRSSYTATSPTLGLSFEDEIIVGFLHVFDTATSLISTWRGVELTYVGRHALQLRGSPEKAWNVYSVFLTEDRGTQLQSFEVDRIEEDLSSTRKIARLGVSSLPDLERALLPMLPLRALTSFAPADYEVQLRNRLSFLPENVLQALFAQRDAQEVARLMVDSL
jgi:hypothetical protein